MRVRGTRIREGVAARPIRVSAVVILSAALAWGQTAPSSERQGEPAPPSSNPANLCVVGDRVYFTADDGIHGPELWVTQGTPETTRLVVDIEEDPNQSGPVELLSFKDQLVFMAKRPNQANRIVWGSDGTPENTLPIGNFEGYSDRRSILACTSETLFLTVISPGFGAELHTWHGPGSSINMVKDTDPSYLSAFPGDANRYCFVGDVLYFVAFHAGERNESLWRSDGTLDGTVMIADVPESTGGYYAWGGRVYFRCPDPEAGTELWVTGEGGQGVSMLKDIVPGSGSSIPGDFADAGSTLLFQATTPEFGKELWRTDGTPEGTFLLKDLNPGAASSEPFAFVRCGNVVLFSAQGSGVGRELWRTDGTPDGTYLVRDIYPGPESSNPYQRINVQGVLYFGATDGAHGDELWKSDGTPEGTVLVKDIHPGPANSGPYHLVSQGSTVYFAAADPRHGVELWKSDGTAKGTVLVADIARDQRINPSSSPHTFVASGKYLYFVANDNVHGEELWRTNGTGGDTRLVKDIFPGPSSSALADLADLNGMLYFRADDGVYGAELWRSDGTELGTALVQEGISGPAGSQPAGMTRLGNAVFFAALDLQNGNELRFADNNGIHLVRDLAQGPASSNPSRLTVWNDRLYFAANDGVHGEELWVTDGSMSGTMMVKDIVPVPVQGARFLEMAPGPGSLYFAVDDGVHGIELWSTNGDPSSTSLVRDVRSALLPGMMQASGR